MIALNETHDPALRSWVSSANRPNCDFPIQNLPFAIFRRAGSGEAWRGGVAIDQHAEAATGNRDFFLNKPLTGARRGDVP